MRVEDTLQHAAGISAGDTATLDIEVTKGWPEPGVPHPLGALGMRRAQRSPRVFDASMMQARLYSRSYHPAPEELAELRSAITRRDGAAFLHNAAGFVTETSEKAAG